MIKKIISDGQTGAGQAALDAAIKLEFPYPNLRYENSIMKTQAREPLRISHSLAEFVMCQVDNTLN